MRMSQRFRKRKSLKVEEGALAASLECRSRRYARFKLRAWLQASSLELQASIYGSARIVKDTDPEDESTISEKVRA